MCTRAAIHFLYIQVRGEPMPDKVTWYHNHKLVSATSPDMETLYDARSGEAELLIGEVFPQDEGVFECVAANIYGRATTRGQLYVEGESSNAKIQLISYNTNDKIASNAMGQVE